MKIVNQQFFEGPSVWFRSSGMLVAMDHGPQDAAFLRWQPTPAEAARALDFLRGAFAVQEDAVHDWQAPSICGARFPALELLLLGAEVLVRDFCIAPAKGRIVNVGANHFHVFVPCGEPGIVAGAWVLTLEACWTQVNTAGGSSSEQTKRIEEGYWAFRRTARHHGLNQTNIAIARAALRSGIPHYRIAPPSQFLQLGQGCFRQRIRETATDRTSGLARALSSDKFGTSAFLHSQGVPTSQPELVASAQDAVEVQRRLNSPAVVKPRSYGKGQGVSVNLSNEQDLVAAFGHAARYNTGVIVERYVQGDDYRLLVVGNRMVAAARRMPAQVVGDGHSTVRQLVDQLNRDPRRGLPFERLLEKVDVDAEAQSLLGASGLTLDSIPAAGHAVPLRRAANLSRGGTSVDVTDIIHPDNRALAERVAQLIGLDVTGIDFLTPDIGRSWRDIPCAILEVNASPGLRPHLASNVHRDVAGPIIDSLFPQGSASRVPTAGITGSAGKTTTCRMLAAILGHGGATVGLATTQGVYVGADVLRTGDLAGGGSACSVMLDPRVQAGVFEFARGGLVKKGMVIDSCDVGAVLNIHDNHIGLDGVNSRQDLARVKRLVVENATKMAVLNADEPLCLAMRPHVSVPVCLVTEDSDHTEVAGHRSAGGTAAILDGQDASSILKLYEGSRLVGEMPAADIPATWGGAFRPATVNALYAAAIAHGMGVPFSTIRAALGQFQSTPQSNPGRMNFYEDRPYRLLVSWADGHHAVAELARFVQTLKVAGSKRLMICSAGNRPDDFILAMGSAAAASFDHFVCSDWKDLRGRDPGGTAALLARGITQAGVPGEKVLLVPDYKKGLSTAFAGAQPGDLLVVLA